MDYIEVPAAPKGMLDKMMSNDGLRVPFSTNGSGAGGFRLPVFSHTKTLPSMAIASAPPSGGSGAELSRRGGIPSFVAAGPSLNGTHLPLANGGNSSLGGVGHVQIAGDSGSSQQGDEVMEKGKRSRGGEGGGRGSSRGGGASSRKRTRAAAPADSSLTTSEVLPDGSVSNGAAGSGGRGPTANGARHSEVLNGDKLEKSNGKRQSGQSTKRGDKKQSQMAAGSAVNDVLPQKAVEANGVLASGLGTGPGLLDVYGLRTRPTDVSRFMVDISLSNLLSGEFEAPTFSYRDNRETKEEVEESLERQIERALSNLYPKPLPGTTAAGPVPSSRTGELLSNSGAKGLKRENETLDLERPLSLEEDDVPSKVGKPEKEMQADFSSATSLEAGGVPLARPSTRCSIDSLPVHPVQSFISRLNLMPSEPLQSLISQAAGAEGEMSGGFADNRMVSGEVIDSCHRNGSVPPFPFSYPHVGPVRADNGRYYSPFVWVRNPPAETSGGGKGETRLSGGKGGTNGAGEEDASSSPSSRRRKLSDGKDHQMEPADASHLMNTSAATQSLAPGQQPGHHPGSGAVVDSANPAATLKNEEPRSQAENDSGGTSSGEGVLNRMQVDTGGNGEGAFVPPTPFVLDGTRSPPAIPLENEHRHQGNGGEEAVRPLETKANLVGGQKDMDSSSHHRLGKPVDLKPEKAEQQQHATSAKDFSGEEVNREPPTNLVPGPSKLEMAVVQPALDAEGNVVRSSQPSQIDSSPGLLGFPLLRDADEVTTAAYILCTMAKSTNNADQDKITRLKENLKRKVLPYPGAPAQKPAKSIRVSSSSAIGPGDAGGGREARRNPDAGGGSVPPSSRALSSERRKSLSQVNDAATSEKPSFPSPRHSGGGGVSTGPRGANTHTGSRSNSFSLKLEKNATTTGREPAKETTNGKELAGRGSSSLPPPVSHGSGPSLKNGHKGVKTNTSSYLHSGSNSKGAVTTATAAASFPKGPTACTTQRVVSGGTSSRGSRTVHTGNSLVSHGAAAPGGPFKSSSRQSIPENRQKTKSDLSGRGSKPNRE